MSLDADEALVRLLHEHQKLLHACQIVYEEELNQPVDATPPAVKEAIRKMVAVMESSQAPGRRKVQHLIGAH